MQLISVDDRVVKCIYSAIIIFCSDVYVSIYGSSRWISYILCTTYLYLILLHLFAEVFKLMMHRNEVVKHIAIKISHYFKSLTKQAHPLY